MNKSVCGVCSGGEGRVGRVAGAVSYRVPGPRGRRWSPDLNELKESPRGWLREGPSREQQVQRPCGGSEPGRGPGRQRGGSNDHTGDARSEGTACAPGEREAVRGPGPTWLRLA